MDREDMPLPPLAIYAGLKRHYNATYSYRTVQNILSELSESGDLDRLDTSALREGRMEAIGDESGRRRTYYMITEQGRERASEIERY